MFALQLTIIGSGIIGIIIRLNNVNLRCADQ